MNDNKNNKERPEAYPKPTQTDQQMNQQEEFISQDNNADINVQSPNNKEGERDKNLNDENKQEQSR